MKKLFILTSVLALGAFSTMAQGLINANNAGTQVYVKIQDTTGQINGGSAVNIGSTATAAGFTGAGFGAVTVSLYGAASSTSLAALEQTTPLETFASSGTQNGIIVGGSTFDPGPSLDTIADNYVFFGTVVSGGVTYSAWSAEAVNITGVAAPGTSAKIFGTATGLINSFVLVPAPEPSTIALGGLGAAALLAFRRRK